MVYCDVWWGWEMDVGDVSRGKWEKQEISEEPKESHS